MTTPPDNSFASLLDLISHGKGGSYSNPDDPKARIKSLLDTSYRHPLYEYLDVESRSANERLHQIDLRVMNTSSPSSFNELLGTIASVGRHLGVLSFLDGAPKGKKDSAAWATALTQLTTKLSDRNRDVDAVKCLRLPASAILYSLGLQLVSTQDIATLAQLLARPVYPGGRASANERTGTYLPISRLSTVSASLEGSAASDNTVLHRWMLTQLRELQKTAVGITKIEAKDILELDYLLALNFVSDPPSWAGNDTYAPLGLLVEHPNLVRQNHLRVRASIESSGDQSEYVSSNLLGDSSAKCIETIERFERVYGKSQQG